MLRQKFWKSLWQFVLVFFELKNDNFSRCHPNPLPIINGRTETWVMQS